MRRFFRSDFSFQCRLIPTWAWTRSRPVAEIRDKALTSAGAGR